MTRFYKVVKAHPLWEEGAIISNEGDEDSYCTIDEVFLKDSFETLSHWGDGAKLVENCPEWFERVYPISGLKKKLFGTRKQAKAAAAVLCEGEK